MGLCYQVASIGSWPSEKLNVYRVEVWASDSALCGAEMVPLRIQTDLSLKYSDACHSFVSDHHGTSRSCSQGTIAQPKILFINDPSMKLVLSNQFGIR